MRIEFYAFNVGEPVGFNLGVALLSGELKQRGHECRVSLVDDAIGLPWDIPTLVERTASFAPNAVALSFASRHARHARSLLAALAARLPGVPTVLGGVHVTFAPEEVIEWPGATAVGRGECDGVLADFIDAWAAGVEAPVVPNFWVRRPDGSLLRNPLGPLPTLDTVSAFDEDVDVAAYTRAGRGFGHVMVTRGCPYRCAYCFNKGLVRRYADDLGVTPARVSYSRRHTVDDAIAEVRRLERLAKGELKAINFEDDTLVADKDWFFAFSARLSDIGLPYVTNATVDRIDEDVARTLAETGCMLVKFGIESGSSRITRDILRRTQRPEAVRRAVRLLREAGVNTRAYVMLGLPTETAAEVLETFTFCGGLQIDTVRPSWFQPYPGTDIYDRCVREQLLVPDLALGSTFSGSPLRWSADHALHLRKVMTIHPWLMNAALPDNPVAQEYDALAQEALAMSEADFDRDDTRRWIRDTTLRLDRQQRMDGVPHYLNPFPERPDVTFLVRPGRRIPLPNVDDVWPSDAPWRSDPVPAPAGSGGTRNAPAPDA